MTCYANLEVHQAVSPTTLRALYINANSHLEKQRPCLFIHFIDYLIFPKGKGGTKRIGLHKGASPKEKNYTHMYKKHTVYPGILHYVIQLAKLRIPWNLSCENLCTGTQFSTCEPCAFTRELKKLLQRVSLILLAYYYACVSLSSYMGCISFFDI